MRKYLLLVLLISFWGCEDDTPSTVSISFFNTYSRSDYDSGNSVQQTEDGGYIVVGNTKSYGLGSWDVWLIKTDSEGQEEWNQTFGEEGGYERGYSILQTDDGGYIITGHSNYYESGILLIKTDSQGQEEWIQTLDTAYTYTSVAYSIQQTEDGGYILTGTRTNNGSGDADVLLIKTDSQGIEQWSKTFGSASDNDWGHSGQQAEDGGYIIAGTRRADGSSYALLIKTDSQGQEEWSKTFEISDMEWGATVQQTSDGGYILTGPHDSDGTGNGDVWLIKTYSHGNMKWNQTFDESNSDYGRSVQQTSDGGYIITGKKYSSNNDPTDNDVLLIKTDPQGNKEWSRTFGDSNGEIGNSVQQTSDGGYIITGFKQYYDGFSGSDLLLIKTDPEGRQ